jgi:hypothetical protein
MTHDAHGEKGGGIFTMKLGEDEGSFSTSPRHLEL